MATQKPKPSLYNFVKPNGKVIRVNETSAPHAIGLGWLPEKEFAAAKKKPAAKKK
jgi:hypothetical protein